MWASTSILYKTGTFRKFDPYISVPSKILRFLNIAEIKRYNRHIKYKEVL